MNFVGPCNGLRCSGLLLSNGRVETSFAHAATSALAFVQSDESLSLTHYQAIPCCGFILRYCCCFQGQSDEFCADCKEAFTVLKTMVTNPDVEVQCTQANRGGEIESISSNSGLFVAGGNHTGVECTLQRTRQLGTRGARSRFERIECFYGRIKQ